MEEYKSYINALKQCAKEHENELVSFAHIRTTDLCNDTANLLETLETESDNAIIIPKGATNGDIVEKIFGKDVYCTLIRMMYSSCCEKLKDWCNAPYKKEEEE